MHEVDVVLVREGVRSGRATAGAVRSGNDAAPGSLGPALGSSIMARFEAMHKDALKEGPSSGAGVRREVAFSADGVRVLRSRGAPGATSSWHTHGDHDVYGYLVRGSARFESGAGGRESMEVEAGDFFCVPARWVHRDVNPSPTEGQEFVLFLHGDGPLVVNVDGPAEG